MARRDQQARAFKALHQEKPGFIMPNAWDCGSAIILATSGYKAIATTSGGIAFALGKPDYTPSATCFAVTRDEMFARMGEIVAAVDVPVNGDLEAGYGDRPEHVAETIRMAIEIGLAGGNIEDKRPGADALYDETLAVDRIIAARETIDAANSDFVLTARTDALVWAREAGLKTAIRRANKFSEAGADCLFPPGADDAETAAKLIAEIPGPVNLVFGLSECDCAPATWIDMGAQRVSTGASIARAALAFVADCAAALRGRGQIAYAARQTAQSELNKLFEAKALASATVAP